MLNMWRSRTQLSSGQFVSSSSSKTDFSYDIALPHLLSLISYDWNFRFFISTTVLLLMKTSNQGSVIQKQDLVQVRRFLTQYPDPESPRRVEVLGIRKEYLACENVKHTVTRGGQTPHR